MTGLSTHSGTVEGGQTIQIYGCGLAETTAFPVVDFGATQGIWLQSMSTDTTIFAQVPAHVAGTVDVTVTVIGTSATSSADQYTFVVAPCTSAGLGTANSPAMKGTTVTFGASSQGCPSPMFEFWIKSPGAALYTKVQAYSGSSSFAWATGSNGPGTYTVVVHVQDDASTGVFSNAYGTWDAYGITTVLVTAGCIEGGVSLGPVGSVAPIGSKVTFFVGGALACPNPEYQIWIKSPGAALYTLFAPYGPYNGFQFPFPVWDTTGNGRGIYTIDVWIRESGTTGVYHNAYGGWDSYQVKTLTLT